jgi:Ca-dependent carbohydrate-binding module xylan-binding/Cellulase (glycosyl hydrolase family 5)
MSTTNAFHISGGQIIGPNGQPFVAKGIAVLDSEMSTTSPASIISMFPGINSINLAVGADGNGYATAQSNAAITAWVNDATSKGLVVTLSDYVPGQPQARSGADLTASLNWYSSLAKTFANNPNVWWTTENEVSGNLGPSEQAIYNAIRGAGNNGLIFMEAQDGNAMTTNGLDPSIYANMTGVGFNIHAYPWEFNTGSTNQADYNNTLKNYVSLFQNFAHSADGVMPVLMGEGGNSTSGSGGAVDDPIVAGNFAVTKAITDTAGVAGGTAGYLMWLHDWHGQVGPSGGDADTLVNINNNTLTDFGAQVAAAIASGPSSPPPPPPPPSQPASPDGTKITAATGKPIIDQAGNSWTLVQSASQGLQIAVNGAVDTTSANVVLLETLKGNMVQENSAGTWYSEPGTGGTWTQTTAPVAPPPPPAPSPDGTKITTASASPIIDQAGNAWTLVQSASQGLQIAVNGTVDTTSANVVLLETLKGNIVQENSAGNWYSEPGAGGPWTQIAAPVAPPPPVVAPPVTTGNGSDTLVLSISEDAYKGDAQFTVSVDGKQLAGTFTATASHAAAANQSFTFKGDWAPGAHAVAVNFLNDAYGGTAATDRNLYVNGISYDGTATGQSAALMAGGPKSFNVTDTTAVPSPAIGSGSDTMVLNVSEDAYLGDAQFTVSVDGKQLGGTLTATALHASAASQNFTFKGDFGSGQHAVAVNFLNDAWGGTAATDRNLYVNGITYGGANTGQSAELTNTGAKAFSVSGGTTPSVTETGDHGSLTKNLSQTGSYTVGGDTFVLTSGNAASVTLGTGASQIAFIGAGSATLTGGSGQATVTADAGSNKFVAGTGTLDVTGGGGKDAYVFHANGGLLKIEDFSIAKGDTLTVDKALQGSLLQASDGQGGTMLTFGSGATHGVDIHGMATLPATNILWA